MNRTGSYTKFGVWDDRDLEALKMRLLGIIDGCSAHIYCGADTPQMLRDYLMQCIFTYAMNRNFERRMSK